MEEQPLHDPQAPAETFDDPGPPPTPNANLFAWVIDLYFRPGRALAGRVLTMGRGPLYCLAVIATIAETLSRIMDRIDSGRAVPFEQSWPLLWAFALGAGLIFAPLWLLFWAAWYHLRVRLSYGRPTWAQSRRVYAASSLVRSLPLFTVMIAYTLLASTPATTVSADSWPLALPVMISPFWMCWAYYRGARTALGVKRAPALLYFVIAPWMFYALVLAFVLVALPMLADPPDTASPRHYQNTSLQFDYPGNWRASRNEGEWIPSWCVDITDASRSTYAGLRLYRTDEDPRSRADELVNDSVRAGFKAGTKVPLDRIGQTRGVGYRVAIDRGGQHYTLWVLVTQPEPGVLFYIDAWAPADEADAKYPGIELIADTMQIVPVDEQLPDTLNARSWGTPSFTLDVPGNWYIQEHEPFEGIVYGADIWSPHGSYARVRYYSDPTPPSQQAEEAIRWQSEYSTSVIHGEELRTCYGMPCAGRAASFTGDHDPYEARVHFIPLQSDGIIEFSEIGTPSASKFATPGFEFLGSSLRLNPGYSIDEARLQSEPEAPPEPDTAPDR